MSDETDYTPEGFTRDKDGKLIPEFKPGKCISTWFGKEHINGNVDWPAVMREVIEYTGKDKMTLAEELGVKPSAIRKILHGDTTGFNFHQGARLRSMHDNALREKGYPVVDD